MKAMEEEWYFRTTWKRARDGGDIPGTLGLGSQGGWPSTSAWKRQGGGGSLTPKGPSGTRDPLERTAASQLGLLRRGTLPCCVRPLGSPLLGMTVGAGGLSPRPELPWMS